MVRRERMWLTRREKAELFDSIRGESGFGMEMVGDHCMDKTRPSAASLELYVSLLTAGAFSTFDTFSTF